MFVLGAALMTVAHAGQLVSTNLETKVLFTKALTVVSPLVIVPWVVFALGYTGRSRYVTRRNVAILSFLPAVTVVLVVTNPLHQLVWRGFGTQTVGSLVVLQPTFGSWVYVYSGCGYLLGVAGIYYLLRMAIGSARLYRGQSVALVIGALAPLSPSVASIMEITAVNYSMMTLGVSGVAFWFAVFRYRLLDISPIARDTVASLTRPLPCP